MLNSWYDYDTEAFVHFWQGLSAIFFGIRLVVSGKSCIFAPANLYF